MTAVQRPSLSPIQAASPPLSRPEYHCWRSNLVGLCFLCKTQNPKGRPSLTLYWAPQYPQIKYYPPEIQDRKSLMRSEGACQMATATKFEAKSSLAGNSQSSGNPNPRPFTSGKATDGPGLRAILFGERLNGKHIGMTLKHTKISSKPQKEALASNAAFEICVRARSTSRRVARRNMNLLDYHPSSSCHHTKEPPLPDTITERHNTLMSKHECQLW